MKKIIFFFAGQGSQSVSMGMELYNTFPTYKNAVDKVDSIYKEFSGESFLELLNKPENKEDILVPTITFPAYFAFQIGLIELYRSLGIKPSIIFAYSFGEVACAYISNAISLYTAVKIIYSKSKVLNTGYGSGSLLVTKISFMEFSEKFLNKYPKVEITCYVSDYTTVITGTSEDLASIKKEMDSTQIVCYYSVCKSQYHSSFMKPYKNALLQEYGSFKSNLPEIEWYSSVHGNLQRDSVDPIFFYHNVRKQAKLYQCVENIKKDINGKHDEYVCIEISPDSYLEKNFKHTFPNIPIISPRLKTTNELEEFLSSIQSLNSLGFNIDLKSFMITNK